LELFLLLLLIFFNGLLAMSEVSFLTAKRSRLKSLAESGKKSAALALRICDDPTQFLSTIQIGITSIGLLSGIVGESIFAAPLAEFLISLGVLSQLAEISSTVLVVLVITYLAIVVGELVPKRVGQSNPEKIAILAARPILLLAKVSSPFVLLLSSSTNAILKVIGVGNHTKSTVTEDEIEAILDEGSFAGLIEQQEREMVRNVFRLDERQLGELMVPRSEIVYVDVRTGASENLERIAGSVHSKIPVCDGGLDQIVGVLSAKTVLADVARGGELSLVDNLKDPLFLPETLTGMDLLERFKASGTSIAFVVDEFGELEGLVTLQDVLDSLVGDVGQDHQDDQQPILREDGSWLIDGAMPIPELKDLLGLGTVPEEEKGRYFTLGGMILLMLERMPKAGDIVQWEGWILEVVDMDARRIDKVLAKRS
jgi:putative hemolysin